MNKYKSIYLVYHFYKNQACGVGVEVAFETHEDALAYIRKDPMIGTEKDFTHWDHYAIAVVEYRESKNP